MPSGLLKPFLLMHSPMALRSCSVSLGRSPLLLSAFLVCGNGLPISARHSTMACLAAGFLPWRGASLFAMARVLMLVRLRATRAVKVLFIRLLFWLVDVGYYRD